MVTYGPDHPRYEAAQRFGVHLTKAMDARKMRPFHLFKAIGGGVSAYQVRAWKAGVSLPSVERAERLASALDDPGILSMVIAGRTGHCARVGCGRAFVTNTGKSRLYCSPRCYKLVHEYDMAFAHARRRKLTPAAARATRTVRELEVAQEELRDHREAVAAFCRECEPEGVCRDASCALRSLSPLALRRSVPASADRMVRMPNRWGPAKA